MYDVVIVGGGPGGLSALIWCHRLGLHAILLERSDELGGQLRGINNPIIDYLGIPAPNGKELQKRFLSHVKEAGSLYECGVEVRELRLHEKRLITEDSEYRAKAFILALGSRDRRLEIPGESEMIARNEVYSASRDKEKFSGKNVAVIGGGDRAAEGALLLAENGANVILIHRNERFRARKEFLDPVLKHPRINVQTNSVVQKIVGKQCVESIVANTQGTLQEIPVDAVFVRIGVAPNSDLLKGQVQLDEDGYVRVNEVGETSVRNIFAVGDLCTRPLFSSIAGSAAQGMAAAKTISCRLEAGEVAE
ncbi:NAD(P)/FAD-dependent oxidoreductase [Effusibacillus consociatus]|uniref:NAD(P)/FAD-dependent oxidoreductase n=1 Tax=Effusibacillus consociatus TaxID=1117041 RepID=A0ABV9PYL8_9BACL